MKAGQPHGASRRWRPRLSCPLVLLGLLAAAPLFTGCGQRPTKPLVLTEQIGELPVQFTSPQCRLPVLSEAPAQPHEVIARIKAYGNPGTDVQEMRTLLHREACALGAQAVVVQPMTRGDFADEVSATHLGYSNIRDYTSTAEYAFQIVGLAIRYKNDTAPSPAER